MDTLGDDSENTAKVSDSAYSNSCSNSQSRKSRSSKSTHSGSNSSGSSGYGGNQSTSGSCKTLKQLPEKRAKDKDGKKIKQAQAELVKIQADVEFKLPEPAPVAEAKAANNDVLPSPAIVQLQKGVPRSLEPTQEITDQDPVVFNTPQTPTQIVKSKLDCPEGFSCVISMSDGVVQYMSSSLSCTLGFPKEMWIGRSFIDFIHPKDHDTFASLITNGLAAPKKVNGMQVADPTASTMFCRIRRYRGLTEGFSIKGHSVTFRPFTLKLTFKNFSDQKGMDVYLIIQATPLYSAFKIPNEMTLNAVPFTIRHVTSGNLEYIDNEAVPLLGYMPQDIIGRDMLQLYHPEDLMYMKNVYETIVKQGHMRRSDPYRLKAQNGHYVKLETEWSSFINPWSRKLEFVIGKHHVIEGPENPDVFQSPVVRKEKVSDKDDIEIKGIKESIVMMLNEVLIMPSELAKQQMTKRCQDLSSFMESLLEAHPTERKPDEELRLEIQENDSCYFERDIWLGGISPHHEYNDSKSSGSTPLSYNQLNFNVNLKRYFDSHQESYENILQTTQKNTELAKPDQFPQGECMSPVAHHSGDIVAMSLDYMACDPVESPTYAEEDLAAIPREYHPIRLTESLLTKHNSEMEKIFVKKHRETRSVNKEERNKMSNETKQKKKDHLVRCNASFVPTAGTAAGVISPEEKWATPPHGLKRPSKHPDAEGAAHKHHCTLPRQMRRRPQAPCAPELPSDAVATVSTSASNWPTNFANAPNPFGSQPMSLVSPITAVPGFVPMYYVPTPGPTVPCTSGMTTTDPNNTTAQPVFPMPTVQYMMYGQAVFGSPIMVSPVNHQVPYIMQQNQRLITRNYEQAYMHGIPTEAQCISQSTAAAWCQQKREAAAAADSANNSSEAADTAASLPSSKAVQSCSVRSSVRSATYTMNRIAEDPGSSVSQASKAKNAEKADRMDGESSYSSFYSSFFNTESSSADDSGDGNKKKNRTHSGSSNAPDLTFPPNKQTQKRKMEPPWMEQVCVTSELIYKYQVLTKSLDEVLISDRDKLVGMEQPSLVNEQLGQLYMDLQLEGVAARLSLEEGLTSSGSSGEDNKLAPDSNPSKRERRKRKYSKLVMIYEEDAPLPPPDEGPESEPSTSMA